MTVSSPTAPPSAHPTFCTACGGALPPAAVRCPRCGAVIGPGGAKRSKSVVWIVVLVVGLFLAVPCLGIVAAIAIPNYLRYQLRSKASETRVVLVSLVQAEEANLITNGAYVDFQSIPQDAPGPQKTALTPEELAFARKLGWAAPPEAYGRYRAAVEADPAGGQSAAFCAESDIDGDGTLAVKVVFLPGKSGTAPDAPCTAPVPYDGTDTHGQVVDVTGPQVF
jgi:Tfp pilus assembly protein PilE